MHFQAVAATEYVLDHLATANGFDPLNFRMSNLLEDGDTLEQSVVHGTVPLQEMVNTLKTKCDYDARQVDIANFNSDNTWKKRALALIPMRWPHSLNSRRFTCQITVYRNDSTIAVVHGGC